MQADLQKVVVIGSGISGMKAAYDLGNNPAYKVTVLEAEAYIGGRTHAVEHRLLDKSEFWFDNGASWVHQSSAKHPITKLLKEADIKYIKTDEQKHSICDSEGTEIKESAFNAEWKEYKRNLKKLENLNEDESIYEGLKKKCSEKLNNPLYMFLVGYDVEFETSAPIKDLSSWQAYNDDEFDGDQLLVLNNYDRICKMFAKNSPITVLLEHKVVEITKKGHTTEVVCQNGKKFEADKVIISVPLGVLKAQTIKFNPPLPNFKIDAINKMGVGNVCKVLIEFTHPPTTLKQHYFIVVSDNVNERGLLTYFLNLFAFTGKPLMMSFGLGESADRVQKMNEKELQHLIANRVNQFADNQVKPDQIITKRTSWRGNPNFGGSYSYPRVGCSYKEYEALARPLFDNGWYFCGEHTTCRYRSTVHGAFLSGIAVSNCILKNVGHKNYEYFDYKWHLENEKDD